MRRAIDTNVLLRLFVADDDEQHARLAGLLGTDLFIPVTVVLEAEWVLRKVLRKEPARIDALFRTLLSLSNVVFGDREAVVRALDGRLRGLDFADALHQALSTDCASLLTFDKAFIRRAAQTPDLPTVHEP